MRIYLHFILVSFFMLGIAPRMAAQGFQMAYGGTAADEGRAIAATADGGMLVTGVFTSAGGGQDLWAMKLNAAGEVEWSRLVGGGAAQLGWCLAPYGSDFFVGGLDNVVGLGQEGLLTRLDASGTPAWIMNYGDASDDVFWLLAVTADNKLWASGYTTGIGANDIAVLKLDGSGAVVWQRTYGQGANEFVHDIEPTADYGVLNVGYRRDYLPLTNYTGYLLRLDSTGNALWAYDYDIGAQEEYFESAVSTLDGGHTICGATNSVGAGGYDGWLVHVDSLGVVQWSHFYGLAGNEYFNSIVQSADGGYVMSGYTTSAGSGGTDFLLVKVDASGTLQWARTLGGPGTDYCQNATSNLVAMPAGYALVGQTNSFGAGGSDLFVARTDLNGFADSCFQTSPLLISGTPTVTRSAFAFTEITPAWGTPSGLTTTSPTPDTTIVCCPRPLAAIDVAGTCGSLTFTFTDSSLGVGAGSTWAWDFNADLTPDAFGPGPHSYTFPGAGAFPIGLLVQNACGKTDTAIVLVTASMGGVVLTTTSCDVSCNGAGDGTATVSATGMGPFSYLWSTVPPATGATVTGLDPGTYTVIVTDSGLGCADTASVTITEPAPVLLALAADSAGCSGASGTASVSPSGGNGNFSYLWSTGSTDSLITGLGTGMYYVTVTDTFSCSPSSLVYFQDFEGAHGWTLNVPTGVNGADNNFWEVDDDESGVAPPGCGAAGLGNRSMHVTSVFCPTCGAAYDAGGLCGILFCPETNMATYSPAISTVGFTGLTLSFDFISNGDALLDNASVFYNDGSGWALLSPSIKSPLCLGGQGQWTNISFPLPASCEGIPNLQIGFNWSNNDDGVGTDPSVAINDVRISSLSTPPVLCTYVDSVFVPDGGSLSLAMSAIPAACGGTGSAMVEVIGSGGPYAYLWSTGGTTDSIGGLAPGVYYVTVTDTLSGGGGGGPSIDTIYFETFDPAGAWTLNVPTGVNGANPNFWQIDDDESGVAPPGCGAAGLGNNSLHITSEFCPTCGAAYDAGGLCGILFCPETNMAAYSPNISTLGFSNLTLSFDFISNGDALIDNASVFYNDGSGWALLSPSIKSPLCLGGQGQWTNISYPLPASCWGIPNLQIGFNWSNNDDGVGADPSVAINNLIITRPDTSGGPPTFTLCTSVDSVTIIDLGGPTLVTTGDTVSCDTTSGMVTVSVTSPGGPYAYLWSTGATTDTVTGLSPGMYYVTVTDTLSGGGGSIILDSIYFETFDPAGAWTLNVPTGVNGADNNFWQIDDDESGVAPPGCGAAGLGNNSLHITSVFCPTCGAAYDAGGLCGILFCPETNMRAESPLISTVGFSNLTLSFDFISNGDALLDNASVEYNDGSGWAVLSPSIKSALCLGGQGQWTNISFALPASCWGIPNLQVGFNWTNNDDGVGTDPSVAINNVVITRPDTIPGGTLVLCSSVDSAEVIYIPDSLVVDADGTGVTCDGVDDGTVSVTVISGVGPFTYDWSTGDTTVGVDSLGFGWYYVTVTNAEGCTDIDSFEVTAPDPIVLVMSSTPAPCSLATGTATVVATGGNPPLTYDWSTGGSTPTIFGLLPGTYTVTVTDALGCFSIGSVNVLGTLGPVVDAGPPSSFCEGDGGVQLFGTAVGGTAPYYWSWWCATPPCGIDSTFDDDPIVNPDFSMWYYVQVTDFNGCTSQVDSVFITVHPKPIVDAGPDLWICAPPAPCEILSPTVSGSAGPFSYQWSPSLGLSNDTIASPCVRPDTTTIYTLQVTDLTTGCRSSATTTDTLSSITVHVNPVPVAEAGPDRDLCFGDTLMLLGVGYGAGPVYDYEWSPFTPPVTLSDNDIPNPLAWPDLTTDYVLVVWSNGCPSYGDTVTVNVHTNPTVDAGPDRDICQGESVLLDATASGDPTSSFYTYAWFDPSTLDNASLEDPTATPDTTTTYYVYGYSEFGCESPMDSVLVTVKSTPIPDAGDPLVICEGDSIVIPASFYYDGTLPADPSTVWPAWTPALNINDTTLLQPTVWPTSSGFYYIALTHNTCTTFDSVLVTVIPGPQITLDADTSIFCEGQTTQLHASGGLGGASFSWSPGYGLSDSTATDPFASPDSTTTYIITLEEGGCSSQDTVTLTVIPLPEMAYFSSQNTGCAPLTVSFLEDVKDELHHIWNFGDGSISNDPSPTHTYMQPGTYVVTLTAVNTGGCEATLDTLIITVTDPGTAEFSSDPSFPADLSLPATTVQFTDESVNATSWVWDFGDGSSSSLENPAHTYTQIGDFTVTLTIRNPDGCISQVSHGPYIVRSPDLFIPNVFSPNEDNNNDVWLVRYTGDQPFQANILDRWGNQLWSTRNKTEGWKGLGPNGQQVPDGVYFYRVVVGNQEYAGDVTLLR